MKTQRINSIDYKVATGKEWIERLNIHPKDPKGTGFELKYGKEWRVSFRDINFNPRFIYRRRVPIQLTEEELFEEWWSGNSNEFSLETAKHAAKSAWLARATLEQKEEE